MEHYYTVVMFRIISYRAQFYVNANIQNFFVKNKSNFPKVKNFFTSVTEVFFESEPSS